MGDSFTEVTSRSWFSRVGGSILGVVFGLILILAMIILLFWNEGRAVTTARSLAEGATSVVSVSADSIDPANEGKLVHVSGPVSTNATPTDPDFGIAATAIRLVRDVEMYQWRQQAKSETKTVIGGDEETVTTYTYTKEWSDRPIDSSDFKQPGGHANPSMELRGKSFQVPEARLGAFELREAVLNRMGGSTKLALDESHRDAVESTFATTSRISIVDGRIYIGRNPASPSVGDYRIGYEIVPVGDASVIGRQTGNQFSGYQTNAGDVLLMVDSGIVPAGEMFADAVTVNTLVTWLLRVVGLVLLFVGFSLLMAPLGVLGDVIPLLGSMIRLGTGIIAFVLAILVGATVIAIAWFWYRPLLSVAVLAVGAIVAFGVVRVGRARRARAAATPASPTVARTPAAPTGAPAPASPPPGKVNW